MICEILHAVLYCVVGLLLLTVVGNYVCRLLLIWSGLFTARTKAAEAIAPKGDNETVTATTTDVPKPDAVQSKPDELPRVGRLVGVFERLILASAILASAWPILAAVVALKSVARFKELDKKLDAEYFLVGSLFSVAWAMAITWIWIVYDRSIGLGLSAKIAAAIAA